eukprot:CAMPEP_0206566948 /NCGR_PEP_ID=MMETSP0325_2-20121206/24958_1 /ASSEMBLY_ACC=CAM_ASM_000347 /TAXON_ID=2866 /ORGANISM="Crypthecodinium cohnii, Strain Seligo" /LENGTH=253 /DNA_ID=CAMNT_0054070067 /DNA_START=40 /DNA_END=801 /DNA_ORIENTATION=-
MAATSISQPRHFKEWIEVIQAQDELEEDEQIDEKPREVLGQVRQLTEEVRQDPQHPKVFAVDGLDKSWFCQKGSITFKRADEQQQNFTLEVSFVGSELSRFGDDYADLSRAEQQATINWLLMIGVAREDYQMTGYKDCKSSGFYFLLHCNYRRTAWRVIGCPHNGHLEDVHGNKFTSNPQDGGQFEFPAAEDQHMSVRYEDGEVWLVDGQEKLVRGLWDVGEEAPQATLPSGRYIPAILTPNCPSHFHAEVRA